MRTLTLSATFAISSSFDSSSTASFVLINISNNLPSACSSSLPAATRSVVLEVRKM